MDFLKVLAPNVHWVVALGQLAAGVMLIAGGLYFAAKGNDV